MYIFVILYLMLVFIHAGIDSTLIKRGEPIDHKHELAIYGVCCACLCVFSYLTLPVRPLPWAIFCTLTALVGRMGFYDITLNMFRGLGIWYISKNADGNYTGTKESWYDDLLSRLKINANVVRLIFMISTALIFAYCNQIVELISRMI